MQIIEVCGEVVIGNKVRVIFRSAGNKFASQPRVFIHLQHVHADMRNARPIACSSEYSQLSRVWCGKPGNQVHIEVADPALRSRSMSLSVFSRVCSRPPCRFLVDKRLHSQAHAIHATRNQRMDDLVGQRPGAHSTVISAPVKILNSSYRGEKLLPIIRLQQARRSAAQVDGVHRSGISAPNWPASAANGMHVLDQPLHIAPICPAENTPEAKLQ